MDAVAATALFAAMWRIPPQLARRWVHALKFSPCDRMVILRHHLALVRHVNLEALFQNVATPAFMMALCDDLCATGMLTRKEATRLQDAILSEVRIDGTWCSDADLQKKV